MITYFSIGILFWIFAAIASAILGHRTTSREYFITFCFCAIFWPVVLVAAMAGWGKDDE